jgi:KDO2-lipid IV(A) lauroyltransferase
VVDRAPARLLVTLGAVLGRAAHRFFPSTRRLARLRVSAALPKHDARAIVRRAFENAGRNAALCLLLRRPHVRALDWVDVPRASERNLREALSRGRGTVFISAHLGPFELIPAAVMELGIPAAIVVRESYDPALDPVVDRHRLSRGIEVIHRGHPSASLRIVRTLRRGLPLGFLPDLGSRVPHRWVRFLETRARWPVGPARIAARMGAPMVVGVLGPTGRPEKPFRLEVVSIPSLDEKGLHEAAADVIARAIELHPEQWLWMGAKSLVIADQVAAGLDWGPAHRA